jgi:outer membrane protein assembly factor BamA
MVVSDTRDDQSVPFYMLPSLGGGSTLRSFSDFRFHDRHMLVVNLESRIALFTHVDAAVFADAGNVARRVGDLTLDKRSYGAGLRLHGHETTTIRLDVAWGREGWRTMFSLNDPFRFHRLSRATSAVPFVP